MEIVKASVRQLTVLQTQIKSFMHFLLQISAIIDQTVERGELVYETAEDTDGLMDPGIKEGCKFRADWNSSNIFAGLAKQCRRHEDKVELRFKSI
jgi:hypothetical protein